MSRLKRMFILLLSIAMFALFGFVSGSTATAAPPGQSGNSKTVAVTGNGPNGAKFDGQFTVASFKEGPANNPDSPPAPSAVQPPPGVAAVGQLTGTLTQPGERGQGQGGGRQVSQSIEMPVNAINFPQQRGQGAQGQPSAWSPSNGQDDQVALASQQAVCNVLDLTLGPLHLNLLGLIVDLNQVHLVITADPSGGLLGSLLCQLAGPGGVLGGSLQQIINLLQQILAAL